MEVENSLCVYIQSPTYASRFRFCHFVHQMNTHHRYHSLNPRMGEVSGQFRINVMKNFVSVQVIWYC